jgi:RNA polymerase sigma-70 factor (ECF subfamily)
MLETLPDEELMLRLKSGELEAFNVLMKRHKDSVLNFCYRLTGHREDAEDIAQEVFIRLFKSVESYYPKARFTVFLYTIARNLCLNYLDRERRRPA